MAQQRVAVFGATGRTGQAITRLLVDRGHRVRIAYRDDGKLERVLGDVRDKVEARKGRIQDAAFVADFVREQDVVISAVGGISWFASSTS